MAKSKESEIVEKLVGSYNCKQGAVRAVRFNVDGSYCLTCGADKSVKLWNPHLGTMIKSYTGHGYEVLDAHSSIDNAQFCSCSLDKAVLLWDVATGKILRKYRGHVGRINCVRFNEEGNVVLSGSLDGSVRIWDCRSKRPDPIQILEEAKDSVTSIFVSDHEIVTGSADCSVRRYDIRSGELISDFVGSPVTCVNLTRDGQCVLTSSLDNTLRLLDKDSGELLNEYIGHKNTEYRVESVISSNDRQILSGSEDGFVFIWDLVSGKVVGKLEHESGSVLHSISYHPSQCCLITACGTTLHVWKSRLDQSMN